MSKDIRPRINAQQMRALDYLRNKERRILVIGDLHCPFEMEGYFEYCLETYDRHACNQVIFIVDLIDSHATSRHETDPDGLSAKTELNIAIEPLFDDEDPRLAVNSYAERDIDPKLYPDSNPETKDD